MIIRITHPNLLQGSDFLCFSSWIIHDFEECASAEQWMKFPGVSPRGLERKSKMRKRGKCILVNLTITHGKKYRQEMKSWSVLVAVFLEEGKTVAPNLT